MRRLKPKDEQKFERKSVMIDITVWEQIQEYYAKKNISMSEVVRAWATAEINVIKDERFA